MNTVNNHDIKALWFGSDVSLFGHLHIPRGETFDLGVVICAPPFGYENICGHRGLRILGDRLAAGGIATLRYDSPGTGDSDGEQLIESWKKAVGDAVSTLRQQTKCSQIAVIGVGLGGVIALESIYDGLDVDKLLLWGVPISGRTWLRHQRAYYRITKLKPNPSEPPPPPPPEGIEELSGFPLNSTLADELKSLDTKQAKEITEKWPAERAKPNTFLISRISGDDTIKLGMSLKDCGFNIVIEDHAGFDQMFDEPHLSIAPEEIFARMQDWLKQGVSARAAYEIETGIDKSVSTKIGKDKEVEEIARYTSGGHHGALFSIETRPVGQEPNSTWLILLTGRAVRHIGPNRIWVRFAREAAKQGYASLRLDGGSVGDSEGEGNGLMPNAEYYQEHIYDDIVKIIKIGVERGAKNFLLTGICSGATASYQIAWRRSDVSAIVMLNPLQLRHDPEDDKRAVVDVAKKWHLRSENWLDPNSYLRALKGQFPWRKLFSVLAIRTKDALNIKHKFEKKEPSYVVKGFHQLAEKPVEIDIFCSGEDVQCNTFLERHFGEGLPNFDREHLRLHRVPNADHTIRPWHAQEKFFEILRDALKRVTT